jgi:hypothetical protein
MLRRQSSDGEERVYSHPDDAAFFDYRVYNACMEQTQYDFTFGEQIFDPVVYSDTGAAPAACLQPPPPYTPYVQRPFDPTRPPMQPGAGIYTSPLTVNVLEVLPEVERIIESVLRALQMPATCVGNFKYMVAVYFTSGYAQFSVRIWSRTKGEGSYAVEVMRERGDRILVTRFFEMLSAALANPATIADLERDFSVDLFDWAPRKLPEDVLAKLPVPHPEAVAAGNASMVGMVTSPYRDVSVSGCASVGKLAAALERTRWNLAGSKELVDALLGAISSQDRYSLDTRSNAAMALLELAILPLGASQISSADFLRLRNTLRTVLVDSGLYPSVSDGDLARVVAMETKEWVADIPNWKSAKSFERYYLARYCAESLRYCEESLRNSGRYPELGAMLQEVSEVSEVSEMSTVEESV